MKQYYKESLTKDEKKIYEAVLKGIRSFENEIVIEAVPDKDVLHKSITSVQKDNPELFYVSFSKFQFSKTGDSIIFYPSYYYDSKKYKTKKKELENKLKDIQRYLSKFDNKRTYRTVMAIHDYLVNNCEYDRTVFEIPEMTEADHRSFTIEGPLLNEKGVCMGISLAFKYLCEVFQKETIIVTGRSLNPVNCTQNADHAWNLINDNGTYAHIDVTWDKCSGNKDFSLVYDYFYLPDDDMKKDHEYSGYPLCRNRHFSFFDRNCLDFSSFDEISRYLKTVTKEEKNIYYFYFRFKKTNFTGKEIADYVSKAVSEKFKYRYKARYSINERQSVFKMVLEPSNV